MTNPAVKALKHFVWQWTPPIIFQTARKMVPKRLPVGVHEFECQGFRWRLDMNSNIALEMLQYGIWEPQTTALVKDFVSPGTQVLSVGANIGYYVLLMARIVGDNGHVWAFEPTKRYRDLLQQHLSMNNLEGRVTVIPYGLSDT